MDAAELAQFVRQIEIKTKNLSSQVFSGEYHAAFKGRGMSFSEVRLYQPGDDVRDIDWNVTARTGNPHIKIYEEEREIAVIMMVDLTASLLFGTKIHSKRRLATELAALIGTSALKNNDKVGALLYGTGKPSYIPPKKGFQHILRIVRALGNAELQVGSTSFGEALEYLNRLTKRKAIIFAMSDFERQGDYQIPLTMVAKRHDLVGIHLTDQFEDNLPDVGVVSIRDLETNQIKQIDFSDRRTRKRFNDFQQNFKTTLNTTFRKAGADLIDIQTGSDYIKKLLYFFKSRHKA